MTLYEALLTKVKEAGLDEKVLNDLLWVQKQALISWGIRAWKAHSSKKLEAIYAFHTLIENEESISNLVTSYYKFAPVRNSVVTSRRNYEAIKEVLADIGGSEEFWAPLLQIAYRAVSYMCAMHLMRNGWKVRDVVEKIGIAERTMYNLRSRVVHSMIKE